MTKNVLAALITAILSAVLVWICAYLGLPFWICLLSSAIFFAAPQANLLGLVSSLFTCLIGIFLGVLFIYGKPYIPSFPYRMEVLVAIIVFVLYLVTQTRYLNYFASAIIGFALLMISGGNWIVMCQAVVIGILFGFGAKMLVVAMAGKRIQ